MDEAILWYWYCYEEYCGVGSARYFCFATELNAEPQAPDTTVRATLRW